MKFKLSVIIPVYNNYNFTKDLLGDLFYCTRNSNGFNFEAVNNYEFIIVDNASTDETKNIETAKINKPQNLKYIRNDINLGFAKACNIGYKESNGEFILFLNNDVRSTKVKDYQNKIEKAIWAHEYLNKLELDEPFNKIIGPTGGELNDDFSFKREVAKFENGDKYLNEFNKTYLSGWCLAARKNVFEKLKGEYDGPFSEKFGLAFFEDTDLSFRAKREKIKLEIVPFDLIHFGHMTAKKMNMSELYLSAKEKFIKEWQNKI